MSGAEYRLYGAPGWGSVLTEVMLVQCGVPFVFEDVAGFDAQGEARQRLLTLNPLGQVPTLVLPDGTVMTESAAIALLLAERHPDAGLAPPPDSPERATFLRLLVWLVANVYPTFTYGDYPERWVTETPEALGAAMVEQRKTLWLWLESQLSDGPWVLGERFSALDIYVGAMVHWRPRRAWFAEHCPKLSGVVGRVLALPNLEPVWSRNFTPAS
ncbi:glutathione S-transferase family protein (plasmid) [Azospirillum argentinense]|uniref:Glutathione S-transferase family protein n=1 Tax=Azospirillum argentinense TaxID=2970906 RepID=A0A4D8PG08_9PROT|nr:glutathione S-transferase family protein [Azospirillum argentinense]QCN97356.1 glutathione S-transferase family protein [Azospirillum argentinense]